MAWIQVSEPIQPDTTRVAATYRKDGLNWEWSDRALISAKSDNGGNLAVTILIGEAGRLTDGDFVWCSLLEFSPTSQTPFVQVLSVGGTLVTLDVPYSVLTADVEELRFLFPTDFTIETGEGTAASPTVTTELLLRPDRNAYYSCDAKQAVISRYVFDQPSTTNFYQDAVSHRIYPTGETPPTRCVGLKQNTGYTMAYPTILYKNVQNLVSEVNSGLYETHLTVPSTQNISNGSSSIIRTFIGNEFEVVFVTPIPDIDLAPVTLPDGMAFYFDGGGVNALGITGAFTAVNNTDIVIENNASSIVYNISFITVEGLAIRERCDNSFDVVWWDYYGGWKMYSFGNHKEYSLKASAVIAADSEDDNYVVAYENAMETAKLTALPEGEAVLDYLNRLLLSTQIYKVNFDSVGGVDNYERLFIDKPSGALKVNPLKAIKNVYTVNLTFATKLLPANEN